jgi:hypothetical protein
MTTRKPKRLLASKYDRQVAKMLATSIKLTLYYEGPAGAYDLDPHEAGFAAALSYLEASPLSLDQVIEALDRFAKHGTFDYAARAPEHRRMHRRLEILFRYPALRRHGKTYEEAVEILAEEFECSESTVRAILRLRQKGCTRFEVTHCA